ncbi:hypothetical protein TGAM01_v207129 [Trichoderma gamsii]|uniref:Uncharacterized protein n=1 Tax=Trichoderma gamsii TaxID=398673 RepID=A0A2P4ZIK4_9HYPO|nr:hypothetical protein TGAM01_v207129 [Trichoderma gamsii]PON24118.1 hypothetical protein TGAM01_v207129 [Trichoderma gamsii]
MKLLFIAFLIFCLLISVRADGWDDFSNNLATDLAPFLALFGEQTTKQYLSESITLLDYYIFSIAPIGILTAVISAIRVCGSPSLRAFIGRAQEGGGDAEAELCSSTSRDVCELYNNGGIARVFGRPKILEVVYDPSKSADETAGIYPCREFVRKRPDEWTRQDKSVADVGNESVLDMSIVDESVLDVPVAADESVANIFAPNLSLNIGIKRQSTVVSWTVAVSGTVLQISVLAFAVIVTYCLKWQKDGKRPDSYACPMAIVGTLIEWGGMFLCAYLIGKTSRKQIFHRNQQSLNKQSTRNAQSKSSSIYWVQPGGQVLGDQVFDPFCYSDHDQPLLQYVSSWKKPSRSSDSELVLWTAVGTTVVGFVIQFVGLRGIHSAISVAQLGAMMVMSVARSALRMQRLKPNDNFLRRCPDEVVGHELDWLAMHIGRDDILPDSPHPRRLLWRFCGARDDTNTLMKERPPMNDYLDIAGKLLAYRTRLAQLTQPQNTWATTSSQHFNSDMVEVREISQRLAVAIESIVNVICSKNAKFQEDWRDHKSMLWSFACDVASVASSESRKSISQHTLYLQLARGSLESPWRLQNRFELEGLLGLWVWSMKSDPEVERLQDRLTISRAAEIPIQRIVSTKENIRATGLNIWLGSEMPTFDVVSVCPTSERCDPSTVQYQGRETRLFGWYTTEPSRRHGSAPFKVWSASTDSSLLSLCAQEVFGAFLVSIFDTMDAVEDIDIQETPHVHLESKLVSEMIQLFTDARLGSREDALLCVLPPIISRLKIPSTESVLATAKRKANEHRRRGEWIKAEVMLKWAWDICIKSQSQPQTNEDNPQHHTDNLVQQAAIALGELYRWAMTISDMNKFSSDGINWLLARKSHEQGISVAVGEIIDRYIDIQNRVNRRDINTGEEDNSLTSTLLRLTLPASRTLMTAEEKSKALCSAAALGWSEVAIALLELGANLDYKDENRRYRTALSLAAESNSIDAVEELIRWGASPISEDDFGRTPLLQASEAGHDVVVKMLLDAPRVDPNAKDSWGDTSLMLAAWNGHEAVARLLLNTGKVANLDSPLWYAVGKGHEAVVQVLLSAEHINPNRQNSDGKSLLMLAAEKGHKAVIQLLLNTGKIDVNAEDIGGKTALLYAEENGHRDVVEILQRRLLTPK